MRGKQCRGGSGVETASMQLLLGQILSAVTTHAGGASFNPCLPPHGAGAARTNVQLRTRVRTPAHIFAWVVAYLGLFIASVVIIALMFRLALSRASFSETRQQRATVTVIGYKEPMTHWQPTTQELDDLLTYAAARGVSVTYDSGYLEIWISNLAPTMISNRHTCLAPNLLQAKLCIDRFCKS